MHFNTCCTNRRLVCGAYHVPPMTGRLSKTLMVSNACSLARASAAMAPEGPAPITATRRAFTVILSWNPVVADFTDDHKSLSCSFVAVVIPFFGPRGGGFRGESE